MTLAKLRVEFFQAGEMYRRVVWYHRETEDVAGTAAFKVHDAFKVYKAAGDRLRAYKKRQ